MTDDFVILPRRGRRSYVAQAIVDAGKAPSAPQLPLDLDLAEDDV